MNPGVMLRRDHYADTDESAFKAAYTTGKSYGRVIHVLFGLTQADWCWIVLAIISVWTAEALNTAFEFLTDVASPEFHPLAAKAKDVAAGAVLIAAMGSVVIGLLVLGPYVLALKNRWR